MHTFKWTPYLNTEVSRVRRISNLIILLIPIGKSYSLKNYFWVLWSDLSSAVREIFTKSQIISGVENDCTKFEDT